MPTLQRRPALFNLFSIAAISCSFICDHNRGWPLPVSHVLPLSCWVTSGKGSAWQIWSSKPSIPIRSEDTHGTVVGLFPPWHNLQRSQKVTCRVPGLLQQLGSSRLHQQSAGNFLNCLNLFDSKTCWHFLWALPVAFASAQAQPHTDAQSWCVLNFYVDPNLRCHCNSPSRHGLAGKKVNAWVFFIYSMSHPGMKFSSSVEALWLKKSCKECEPIPECVRLNIALLDNLWRKVASCFPQGVTHARQRDNVSFYNTEVPCTGQVLCNGYVVVAAAFAKIFLMEV